jgi:hypothetical protein
VNPGRFTSSSCLQPHRPVVSRRSQGQIGPQPPQASWPAPEGPTALTSRPSPAPPISSPTSTSTPPRRPPSPISIGQAVFLLGKLPPSAAALRPAYCRSKWPICCSNGWSATAWPGLSPLRGTLELPALAAAAVPRSEVYDSGGTVSLQPATDWIAASTVGCLECRSHRLSKFDR